MKKICIVVATLFTARAFLLDQIAQLARRYRVTVAANDADEALFEGMGVELVRVPIERRIAPMSDLRALWSLYRLFKRERFDAVHSVTPKAGLLAMIASRAACVPARMHTFTGQVWATRTGAARLLLKTLDRLTVSAATHVIVDSRSQHAFLQDERVLPPGRGEVLAHGSVSGVDTLRFRPDDGARTAVRRELGLPRNAVLFVYLGRLSRDKGVLDLAQAFGRLATQEPRAYLVLVGPDEERLTGRVTEAAGDGAARVRVVGMTAVPERYLAAADVFCLPSRREGFGSVIIEAAAAGVPAIGTRIYGIVDAIDEGRTGMLVPPADPHALATAMLRLACDPHARQTLGAAARARALAEFAQPIVTAAVLKLYERVVPDSEGRAPPTGAVRL